MFVCLYFSISVFVYIVFSVSPGSRRIEIMTSFTDRRLKQLFSVFLHLVFFYFCILYVLCHRALLGEQQEDWNHDSIYWSSSDTTIFIISVFSIFVFMYFLFCIFCVSDEGIEIMTSFTDRRQTQLFSDPLMISLERLVHLVTEQR